MDPEDAVGHPVVFRLENILSQDGEHIPLQNPNQPTRPKLGNINAMSRNSLTLMEYQTLRSFSFSILEYRSVKKLYNFDQCSKLNGMNNE